MFKSVMSLLLSVLIIKSSNRSVLHSIGSAAIMKRLISTLLTNTAAFCLLHAVSVTYSPYLNMFQIKTGTKT